MALALSTSPFLEQALLDPFSQRDGFACRGVKDIGQLTRAQLAEKMLSAQTKDEHLCSSSCETPKPHTEAPQYELPGNASVLIASALGMKSEEELVCRMHEDSEAVYAAVTNLLWSGCCGQTGLTRVFVAQWMTSAFPLETDFSEEDDSDFEDA